MAQLKQTKLGIVPGTVARAPRSIARHFESDWAPVERLAAHLVCLPDGALRFLATIQGGHILVAPDTEGYFIGEQSVRQRTLWNVAYIPLAALLDPADRRPLQVVAQLLDHYLGCLGAQEGPWLSEGGGYNARWQAVGCRILQLAGLGYLSEGNPLTPRAYFARALAWYCHDRRGLNVADPKMQRLLADTIMNDGFWR